MKDGKKTIYSFQNRLIVRDIAQNIEFLDKNVNAYDFVHHLSQSLNGIKSQSNWYLE